MTDRAAQCLLAILGLFAPLAAHAAPLRDTVTIGYLELAGDPRYDERPGPAESSIAPPRPEPGADMGVSEVNLAAIRHFALDKVSGDDVAQLADRVAALAGEGVHWFLADLPDDALAQLAKSVRERDVLLLNISAPGDALRGSQCQKDLVHIFPSRAMLVDALAQFLIARKWPDVLVLEGPLDDDKATTAAFGRAAKRYGLKISAKRDFLLSNDPRQREKDNVALLTGDASYDVVFVADAEGEFARALPYDTIRPRPVIGAAGLIPRAWDWAWDRYGAPQVSHRFEHAAHRRMESADWAAWLAVRAVGEAVARSGAADTAGADAYLLGPQLSLDGAKGPPLSLRPWDHQLRQPILLATSDDVVAAAPLPGFLHPTEILDTLGADRAETTCRF